MVSDCNGENSCRIEGVNGNIPIPLHISTSQRGLIANQNPRNCCSSNDLAVLPKRIVFLKSCSLDPPSSKFYRFARDRDEISRSIPSSRSRAFRQRFNTVFPCKIDWKSLLKITTDWITKPMNVILLVWIICVSVSGTILFLIMTGILDGALPQKSQRDSWSEANNQILNALFTLLALYQHPTRFHHLVLLLRWRPEDISKLRNVYCKNGTYKPHEWAHMMFVVVHLHLNCFAQYTLCSLNLGYDQSNRPAVGVGMCLAVAMGASAIAGIYSNFSPLGRDYEPNFDVESQVRTPGTEFRAKSIEKMLYFGSSQPTWSGGIFDFWDDLSSAYLSLFCSFCVFGWNMERLGFGNMYVHIATFILLCMAPFWIFNLVAIDVNNDKVRSILGILGILLCVFGLLYGGFWRIRMRKKYKLPTYDFCCNKPAVSDCLLWLFCCWCSLAQEVRTGNLDEVVEDEIFRGRGDECGELTMLPLPRENALGKGSPRPAKEETMIAPAASYIQRGVN